MDCVRCGKRTNVTETRVTSDGHTQRRRICPGCAERYVTLEALRDSFQVCKRNGAVEQFDRDKLVKSVRRAVGALPFTDNQTDALIRRIIASLLREGFGQRLSSQRVGEVVLAELAMLPAEGEMASVRYALYFYDQVDGASASATEFARWLAGRQLDLAVPPPVDEVRLVFKRGRRALEPYDRSKLARSIGLALRGRLPTGILKPRIEQICDQVEAALADQGLVTSSQIGTEVVARLRSIDLLAYLRYATIFKRLDALSHFALEAAVALDAGQGGATGLPE